MSASENMLLKNALEQMKLSKEFLTSIVNGEYESNLPPLKQVVGRLKDIKSIVVKADFDHYGSGYSSYVHLYLSRKDKSDVKIEKEGNLTTENVNGLMMYLCRLAPYAVYAKGEWSTTYENGKSHSGYSHYIEPQMIGSLPNTGWQHELIQISDILKQLGITILTKEELNKTLDFEISIPTVLSRPPYKIFDCFFYWED